MPVTLSPRITVPLNLNLTNSANISQILKNFQPARNPNSNIHPNLVTQQHHNLGIENGRVTKKTAQKPVRPFTGKDMANGIRPNLPSDLLLTTVDQLCKPITATSTSKDNPQTSKSSAGIKHEYNNNRSISNQFSGQKVASNLTQMPGQNVISNMTQNLPKHLDEKHHFTNPNLNIPNKSTVHDFERNAFTLPTRDQTLNNHLESQHGQMFHNLCHLNQFPQNHLAFQNGMQATPNFEIPEVLKLRQQVANFAYLTVHQATVIANLNQRLELVEHLLAQKIEFSNRNYDFICGNSSQNGPKPAVNLTSKAAVSQATTNVSEKDATNSSNNNFQNSDAEDLDETQKLFNDTFAEIFGSKRENSSLDNICTSELSRNSTSNADISIEGNISKRNSFNCSSSNSVLDLGPSPQNLSASSVKQTLVASSAATPPYVTSSDMTSFAQSLGMKAETHDWNMVAEFMSRLSKTNHLGSKQVPVAHHPRYSMPSHISIDELRPNCKVHADKVGPFAAPMDIFNVAAIHFEPVFVKFRSGSAFAQALFVLHHGSFLAMKSSASERGRNSQRILSTEFITKLTEIVRVWFPAEDESSVCKAVNQKQRNILCSARHCFFYQKCEVCCGFAFLQQNQINQN